MPPLARSRCEALVVELARNLAIRQAFGSKLHCPALSRPLVRVGDEVASIVGEAETKRNTPGPQALTTPDR